MLSCIKATELIEKKIDGDISFLQKMQLTMHKSMCKACTLYEKQSYILDDVLKQPVSDDLIKIDLEKFKAKIIDKINS